jgi:hypothetical protein
MKLEKLFSTQEGAKVLNLPVKKLRSWKDAIGYVQLGSRIYFRQSDLESFFETRLVAPAKTMRRRRWRFLAPLKKALSC